MAALAEIDELYNTTISKLPIESRLSYCIKHLDKIQSVLTKNMDILHPEQKEQLKKMIEAAQKEINKLEDLKSRTRQKSDGLLNEQSDKANQRVGTLLNHQINKLSNTNDK
jgi:DNA repair exonuclease SbcCD ATPase subunit